VVAHGHWALVEFESAGQEQIEVVVAEKRHQENWTAVIHLVAGRAKVRMEDGLEGRQVEMKEHPGCLLEKEERLVGMEERPVEILA